MKQPTINAGKYRGQWLALDPKTWRVMGHDPSLKKARAAAKQRGVKRPLMYGVPKSDGIFIGESRLTHEIPISARAVGK